MSRKILLGCLALLGFWAAAIAANPTAPITALTFSPDGAFLLSAGYGSVSVRSVKEGKVARELACGLSQIHEMVFSPDGRLLAVAGGTPGKDGAVRLLTWPQATRLLTLADAADLVTSVAFSPDGARLATASADRSLRVYSVQRLAGGSGKVKAALEYEQTDHAGPVLAVRYSPDGKLLVTASADRALKVWESGSGKLLRSLGNHTGIVHDVTFRPAKRTGDDPAECASGSDDKTVRIWQPEAGRMVRIVRHHEGPVMAVLYSHAGSQLFSAGSEGVIRRIDSSSDQIAQQWKAHDDWIYSLALSPDGATLASGDWSGRVRLWESSTGKRVAGW